MTQNGPPVWGRREEELLSFPEGVTLGPAFGRTAGIEDRRYCIWEEGMWGEFR